MSGAGEYVRPSDDEGKLYHSAMISQQLCDYRKARDDER